ncbi:helix-turn-helix transcriptional regulator [Pendulispora rubella]|uniref:Helix-turn-helix transcriptional regulator n=1 Tax=Pendulispora rubella TaxID=2741070 RepID=A0ABZ2KYG4_9BACT
MAATAKSSDPVTLIEQAYNFGHEDEGVWLEGVARGFHAVLPKRGLRGVHTYIYRRSGPTQIAMERNCLIEAKRLPTQEELRGLVARHIQSYPKTAIRIFQSRSLAWFGDLDPEFWNSPSVEARDQYSLADSLLLNSSDATGLGCMTNLYFDKRVVVPKARQESLSRAGAHVVAALRIRRAMAGRVLSPNDAEAVLSPSGRIEEASGGAKTRVARDALRDATVAMDRARGRLRRSEPERAVALWKVLVAARWSLLDHFDGDGRRYVVAYCNATELAPHERLTPREHQVVALATQGHSNKSIAYELGISISTVGVLLGRAARRLGVNSRAALIRTFEGQRLYTAT